MILTKLTEKNFSYDRKKAMAELEEERKEKLLFESNEKKVSSVSEKKWLDTSSDTKKKKFIVWETNKNHRIDTKNTIQTNLKEDFLD